MVGASYNSQKDDGLLILYNTTTGDSLLTIRYNGPADQSDYFIGCTTSGFYNLYIVGSVNGFDTGDFLAMNYYFGGDLVQQTEVLPHSFYLHQNYPNPFNPTTTISFDVPEQSLATLKVLNILGQTIKVLVNGELTAGGYRLKYDAGDLPSGIYFYRMETEKFNLMKGMQLIR